MNRVLLLIVVCAAAALSGMSLYVTLYEPDFSQVPPRNLVKNAIMISLLEEDGGSCRVLADGFEVMADHQYFVRSADLARELDYDANLKTLRLPCEELHGTESALHVWYVIPESPVHAKEYTYFVTGPDEMLAGLE